VQSFSDKGGTLWLWGPPPFSGTDGKVSSAGHHFTVQGIGVHLLGFSTSEVDSHYCQGRQKLGRLNRLTGNISHTLLNTESLSYS